MSSFSRQQLMDHLDAKQKNTVWSWCAIDEDGKKVYLSIWEDTREKRGQDDRASYIVQRPNWGIDQNTGNLSAARKDHDEKLSKVFDDGYEAYGYVVVAKDTEARPREIEKTKTSFIFLLELKKCPDGTVLGYPIRRLEIR